MPYLTQSRKDQIGPDGYCSADNGGDLNYLFTRIAVDYFKNNGGRYQQINDVLGALEGAKLEFYRRVAVPYEDKKCEENGDVYV